MPIFFLLNGSFLKNSQILCTQPVEWSAVFLPAQPTAGLLFTLSEQLCQMLDLLRTLARHADGGLVPSTRAFLDVV
jgi:hypothetical protein